MHFIPSQRRVQPWRNRHLPPYDMPLMKFKIVCLEGIWRRHQNILSPSYLLCHRGRTNIRRGRRFKNIFLPPPPIENKGGCV